MKKFFARDYTLPLLITGAAFLLRVAMCRNYAITMDEAWTMQVSALPLHDMIRALIGTDGSPAGYIIMHFWLLPSMNYIWVQMCPILMSTASVWLTFKVGEKLLGRTPALLGASFCALSALLVQHAHFIRYPSMIMFFALISLNSAIDVCGWRRTEDGTGTIPHKGFELHHWVIIAVCTSICLYLHYYAIFWVVALNVFFLVRGGDWKLWLKWLAAQAAAGASFLPWYSVMMSLGKTTLEMDRPTHAAISIFTQRRLFLFDMIVELLKGVQISLGSRNPVIIGYKYAVLAFLVLGLIVLIRVLRASATADRRTIISLIVACVASLIAGLVFTALFNGAPFVSQYFVYLTPLFLLVAACMILREKSRTLGAALGALLFLFLTIPLANTYRVYAKGPNTADIMKHMASEIRPGDVILLRPAPVKSAIWYYFKNPPPVVCIPMDFDYRKYIFSRLYIEVTESRFDEIRNSLAPARRIWYYKVNTGYEFDPQRRIESYLESGYLKKESIGFVEVYPECGTLSLYEKK